MIRSIFLLCIFLVGAHVESVEVQGHRGARGLFPENTLPAFAAAIEVGTNTLELDLHVTEEGVIVIHHDFFVCDTPIRSLKLSEIKKIDCGSKQNPLFPRQKRLAEVRIPTLDELFDMISHSSDPHAKNVRLNLEIKRDPRSPELSASAKELAQKIVSKVREKGFSQRVYYSSFDPQVLMEVRKLDAEVTLGLIFSTESLAAAQKLQTKNPIGMMMQLAKSFRATILSPEYRLLKEVSDVHLFHESGFQVIPWTVNAPEQWTHLIEMGVDGLITDYPHDLIEFLENKSL